MLTSASGTKSISICSAIMKIVLCERLSEWAQQIRAVKVIRESSQGIKQT